MYTRIFLPALCNAKPCPDSCRTNHGYSSLYLHCIVFHIETNVEEEIKSSTTENRLNRLSYYA